jgi:ERCC4-related helicase
MWFLTPTTVLCEQQFRVLQSQISSVQIKCFTSNDNIDKWTDRESWDTVLTNVSIVVSTYAVLHDALCHAFLVMDSLALLVFDEGLSSVLARLYKSDVF